jgi:hypothetical protein
LPEKPGADLEAHRLRLLRRYHQKRDRDFTGRPLTSNRKIEPVESPTAKLPPDGVRTSTSAPSATRAD